MLGFSDVGSTPTASTIKKPFKTSSYHDVAFDYH
jgi:hypothetical protein